jgi:hypothetical protein
VDKFRIANYVQKEHVTKAEELIGLTAGPTLGPGQEPCIESTRQNIATFIRTAAKPFRLSDPVTLQLGPFLNVKWLLERTRPMNNQGSHVGGDTLKIIRRSERLKEMRTAKEAALTRQIGALSIQDQTPPRPTTPPKAPQTPSAQLGGSVSGVAFSR